MSKLGNSIGNSLYGLGGREDNTAAIINSEITKLIALKETEAYCKMLAGLQHIEEQYGLSARLIHKRAHCLMALGELGKYGDASRILYLQR